LRKTASPWQYDSPTRGWPSGELFRSLPTASLDRVVHRDVRRLAAATPATRRARCAACKRNADAALHPPLNDAREAARLLPVNAFWVSGAGALHRAPAIAPAARAALPARCRPARRLGRLGRRLAGSWTPTRMAALRRASWQRPQSARLTLCGERSALTLAQRRAAWV
jgi:hypothetical protein